jgi:hypothetical protein
MLQAYIDLEQIGYHLHDHFRRITIHLFVNAPKFPGGFTIETGNTDVKKSGCFALYC